MHLPSLRRDTATERLSKLAALVGRESVETRPSLKSHQPWLDAEPDLLLAVRKVKVQHMGGNHDCGKPRLFHLG